MPFNTVGPNSSCNLVRWLHRHPKLANEELTLESSIFKVGQFHAREQITACIICRLDKSLRYTCTGFN